jgi:hypothetical protein
VSCAANGLIKGTFGDSCSCKKVSLPFARKRAIASVHELDVEMVVVDIIRKASQNRETIVERSM